MCCETTTQHGKKHGHGGSCGCGSGPACHGPFFWSKKKRIQILENSLECLEERANDIKELLKELKEEE